jgi:hypothetical protein
MHQVAASVARICVGLDAAGIQQIFVQLFPSPGCRPMAHAFELAYCESSVPHKNVVKFTTAAA